MWHLAVDIARELDKTGLDACLLGFPREIEGIDRNAMSPEAGAWEKWHETEGLRSRRLDNLPNVNAHAITHHGKFVDKADVDHSEGIFEQLYHLGDLGGA